MPSRRTVLGAIGAGASVALAGCIDSNTPERVQGYVQFKSIAGVHDGDDVRETVTILRVDASFEPNDAPPEVWHVDDEWADWFPEPRMPVVGDELHAALTDRFDAVRYVVGTTSPGWADAGERVGSFNVATTRANFNRVQVHAAVTVSSDGTSLTIHSVDGVWEFDDA
jgi:hypothetical protein